MTMKAQPSRSTYKPGEIMDINVVIYSGPPAEGYIVVEGMGMQWKTEPIRDMTFPTYLSIPIQIPYCSTVPGTTVTGYPITCGGSAPTSGQVTFTVKFMNKGAVVDSTSFTVTILGKSPAQAQHTEGGGWDAIILATLLGMAIFGG